MFSVSEFLCVRVCICFGRILVCAHGDDRVDPVERSSLVNSFLIVGDSHIRDCHITACLAEIHVLVWSAPVRMTRP